MTNIIYKGKKFTIETAIRSNGSMPAKEFINNLPLENQAKVYALFKRLGDMGEIRNKQKFKKLEDEDLWEFKSNQIRIFCYFAKDRIVILTHGTIKKQQKLKRSEIDKALQIKKEYLQA